jgi:lysophospholipase L1-like esterase
MTGGWIAAGVVLAEWGVLGRAPLPLLPPGDDAALPGVVVLAAVTAWRGHGVTASKPGFAVLIAATFAVIVVTSTFPGRLHRLTSRLVRLVDLVVGRFAFLLLGLAVVVVPWAVQRLTFVDPLEAPTSRGSAWVRRGRRGQPAAEMWAPDPAMRRLPLGSRIRRAVVPVAAAAVLLGIVLADRPPATPVVVQSNDAVANLGVGGAPDPGRVPAAFRKADWYPRYLQDIAWLWSPATAWDPLAQRRLKDVQTETVNVIGGDRASWSPPPCDCRRLTVWFYGGSTAFGLGQRDDRTIPSQIAREAAADGLTVDVVNKGVPGDLLWEEAQRFQWDVTVHRPPDLVVFYDGVNEIWGTQRLNNLGLGDTKLPVEPLKEEYWEGLVKDLEPAPAPDGDEMRTPTTIASLSAKGMARLAVTRYDRSRQMASDVATARRVPIEFFWQPNRYSRPQVPGEPDSPGAAWARENWAAAIAALPPGVHNLNGVFRRNRDPIYSDDVHTNEEGAAIIARAIYRTLSPKLHRLSRSGR